MPRYLSDKEEIERSLPVFGLTPRESRIYAELATHGPAAAGTLARKLSLHRLDVYYDLKHLQQKEMVEATLARPMIYRAQPLNFVLRSLEQSNQESLTLREDSLNRLKKVSNRLESPKLGSVRQLGPHDGPDTFRIIGGRKAIRTKWMDLLEAARKEVLVVATERGPAKSIFLSGMDQIADRIKRGVRVKVFTPVTSNRNQRIARIGSKVRHLAASAPAGLCVVDGKTAMIITGSERVGKGSIGQETAVLTTSKSIGQILRTLFFVGWNTSPSFEEKLGRSIRRE